MNVPPSFIIGAPAAPQLEPGFAPVFAGWNVWDLYQADKLDESILGKLWHAGMSPERLLRVWIEDQLRDNAHGAEVADPANPAALSGDPIQIIPRVSTLDRFVTRQSVPELSGAMQLGTDDSKTTLRTVRFYNRGLATVLPWPHDQNFVLDIVYTPSLTNSITNSQPPSTLAGGLDAAGRAAADVGKAVVWGVGALAVVMLLSTLSRKR